MVEQDLIGVQEQSKRIEDHQYWMAIIWRDGRPVLRSSADMKQYKPMVLQPEAEAKFLHVMTDYVSKERCSRGSRPSHTDAVLGMGKRQEGCKLPPSALMDMPKGQMMPQPRKSTKRRHPTIIDNFDHSPFFLPDPKLEKNRLPSRGERKVQLLVKDLRAQEQWFGEAFKAVQQVACRTIAKNWIKKIHPKKVDASKTYDCRLLTADSNPRTHTTVVCPEMRVLTLHALDRHIGPRGLL